MIAQDREIDGYISAYESSAQGEGDRLPLDSFLPRVGNPLRIRVLEELVRVDMEYRWKRQDRALLDGYLTRFPEINREPFKSGLAIEEYRLRQRAGETPAKEEYRDRYGVDVQQWPAVVPETSKPRRTVAGSRLIDEAEKTDVFDHVSSAQPNQPDATALRKWDLDEAMAAAVFPVAGDDFLDFKLLRELGRGSFGRVFLAEQRGMADRPMVLKLAPDLGCDIHSLARLQHTNIVPIYSTHRTAAMQAFGMPYFGALTLDNILRTLQPADLAQPAAWIGEMLAAVPSARGAAPAVGLQTLSAGRYTDAILWIGERLADALVHAHDRGIIHQDIKPANVLLSDDGQPMLLDFNLARDTSMVWSMRARIGGTLPYMSAEQLLAFNEQQAAEIGPAIDLYSLGALLHHMLTLETPYPIRRGEMDVILPQIIADRKTDPAGLRQRNSDVSPATEAIVLKCLATDAKLRYQSAAELYEDLVRQRANRPLKYADEASTAERVRKWYRRNRWITSPPALAATAAALLLTGAAITVQLSLESRAHGQEANRLTALRKLDEFLGQADQVRQAAGTPSGLQEVLATSATALGMYDATRDDWERAEDVQRLPAAERERLRGVVGELAFHSARAEALVNRDSDAAAKFNALAESALDATTRAVVAQRNGNAAPVGDGGRGDFLWALDAAACGRPRSALPVVTGFLALHTDDFGGWYLKARCHDALGQFEDAHAAYSTCAALKPALACTYVARGELAFRNGSQLDQALADFNRAIQLDPRNADAHFYRATTLEAVKRLDEANKELNSLESLTPEALRVPYVRARVREALGDTAGAATDRERVRNAVPRTSNDFITRGNFRLAEDPQSALADFQDASRLDPFSNEALLNQAHVLGERLGRVAEAVAVTDRLLAMNPDHPMARGGRAVYLARLCQTAVAVADLVMNIGGGERRLPGRFPPFLAKPAFHAAFAASQLFADLGVHSKSFRQVMKLEKQLHPIPQKAKEISS